MFQGYPWTGQGYPRAVQRYPWPVLGYPWTVQGYPCVFRVVHPEMWVGIGPLRAGYRLPGGPFSRARNGGIHTPAGIEPKA